MNDILDEMYRDIILDHYRSPRGKKLIGHADISSTGQNPSCGDEIAMQVTLDDGTVKDIHVGCTGCAISVASGSMLAEFVKGKSFEEVKKVAEVVKKMLKGEEIPDSDELGDIDALKGVRQFPVRIKCALLAWMTLIEGIQNFEKQKKAGPETVTTTDEDEQNAATDQ